MKTDENLSNFGFIGLGIMMGAALSLGGHPLRTIFFGWFIVGIVGIILIVRENRRKKNEKDRNKI